MAPAYTILAARVALGSAMAAHDIRHTEDGHFHTPVLVLHPSDYSIHCNYMLAKFSILLMLQALMCQPHRAKNHKTP